MEIRILDENNVTWVWDGQKVYVPLDEQMSPHHLWLFEELQENGYPATSLEEALSTLVEGGYITKEQEIQCTVKLI